MARGGDRVRMPASTAGITQNWDDVRTKIRLKPEHVLVLAAIIVLIEILLQLYGPRLFG